MNPVDREPGETFRLLTRLFLRRLIDNDLMSPHADRHESLAVVEIRGLAPLDLNDAVAAVRRTGRAIVVAEAPRTGSLAAEIAATLNEEAFYSLEAPVLRVGGFDVPYPPSRLEHLHLPDVDRVLDAVDRSLAVA